jgi:S-DNA-T family DNA segregation ATPase FtsK/SpoIIIE
MVGTGAWDVVLGVGRPRVSVPVPVWVGVVEWAVIGGLLATFTWLVWRRWRRHRRPNLNGPVAAARWVAWVRARWPWDAQNLGLVLVDETTRHRRQLLTGHVLPPQVLYPTATFEVAANGLRCHLSTLPGVGLDQVTKAAGHLANAWGCMRVDVTQDGPGRLLLRGHLSDPLAQTWAITPDGRPLEEWSLHVGADENGQTVLLPLGNLSGLTVAGVPGTGKTSLQRWWLCQLAGHPAVQVAVLDGKVSDPLDGDYGALAGRCFAAVGDDLGQANRLLGGLYGLMRDRSRWLRANRATAQFWEHGPTADCPLIFVICDESHTYITGAARKDRELCEANTWYMTKLAKEGRSRGVVSVFITQKQTADAIPTAIRDVCQVGIAFGTRTMDGAVAALGDEIRQYPDIAPTGLIGRQWTGVAVMRLPDRAGYHRVRTPYVTEADAARIAEHYAVLCSAPARGDTRAGAA